MFDEDGHDRSITNTTLPTTQQVVPSSTPRAPLSLPVATARPVTGRPPQDATMAPPTRPHIRHLSATSAVPTLAPSIPAMPLARLKAPLVFGTGTSAPALPGIYHPPHPTRQEWRRGLAKDGTQYESMRYLATAFGMAHVAIGVVFRHVPGQHVEFVVVAGRDTNKRINYRVLSRSLANRTHHTTHWATKNFNSSAIKYRDINQSGFTIGRFPGKNKGNEQIVRDVINTCANKRGMDEWPVGKDGESGEEVTDPDMEDHPLD